MRTLYLSIHVLSVSNTVSDPDFVIRKHRAEKFAPFRIENLEHLMTQLQPRSVAKQRLYLGRGEDVHTAIDDIAVDESLLGLEAWKLHRCPSAQSIIEKYTGCYPKNKGTTQ